MPDIVDQIRDEMTRAYRPRREGVQSSLAADSPLLDGTALRSAMAALHASYAQVGKLPPEPPTFRGRMGARLVKLVNRMLFWYTPQIVYFQYSALRAFEEQARILDSAERRIRQLESELAQERDRNENLRREWDSVRGALRASTRKPHL